MWSLQHFLARPFEIFGYLLFFHVCNTSVSVRLSSLACVSRRSNRNLIAGGKLQPRRYFIKTVWKSRSTNCCRVPCQSHSKSNWKPCKAFLDHWHNIVKLWRVAVRNNSVKQLNIHIQETEKGWEKQTWKKNSTSATRHIKSRLFWSSKCKSLSNLVFSVLPAKNNAKILALKPTLL